MTRRCKPGQRARFIGTWNHGKIVVVVRRYAGERVDGATWGVRGLFPWVVTSLSGPLDVWYVATGEPCPGMTVVADDSELEPLDDDENADEPRVVTDVDDAPARRR